MTTPLDVVAGIIEYNGKILLARRPESGDQTGYWEFPGGKMEAGETQPQALARELREELGIDAEIGHYIASQQWQIADRLIVLHAWHTCQFTGIPQPLCHSELVWCSLTEAQEYADNQMLAPADIPLLMAFIKHRAVNSTER
ncbi:pyrimidine (deoxy)nucleoside triphosphate diphosphatase [Citrobacter sp. JGM124]|uniref:pyrimidine (deoxy)nucleoside triphosphate diphosphatase n=1 Tax=Citrobacter sp. JGM124 TaxID=2799789 RepID=UPI001BAC3A2C|nr:pyrimidine (deoxy)nucleoside triphosphate diphosphatase [Citrobacter sp. JGM124]MBS0847542.1 pyrimidine (deoxy)nucleoside triphosphate diphosphatase [Citrobacter sp. JGM124]